MRYVALRIMKDYCSIIGLWPSAEALAADIGEKGVTVRSWRLRNSIPARHWPAVVNAAADRGFKGVTFDRLSIIAAQRYAIEHSSPPKPTEAAS